MNIKNTYLLFLLLLASTLCWSASTKTIRESETNVESLDCYIDEMRSSESIGFPEFDKYYFKSTNGKSAVIKMDTETNTSLKNCRVIYRSGIAPDSGEWGITYMKFQQIDKSKPWKYDLNYTVEWQE